MKALVIGGARSGIGVARLLNSKGYQVTLTTNQDFIERHELENLGVKVSLNDKDMGLVDTYDFVVKNPGIPNDHPLVSQFNNVVNEIEVASLFSSNYNYYAISGTNGKTTTATLLWEMLQKKNENALLAGNVGYALSEAVYKDGNIARDVSLEISAFQMEGSPTFSPDVYGLINLSPDHLDRYDSEQDYYAAKLEILNRVKIFVRNIEDKNIHALTQNYTGKVIDVSLHDVSKDVFIKDEAVYFNIVKLFSLAEFKLVGEHNILNASIAAVMAFLAGVELEDIQTTIHNFKGVEHRIEFVREIQGYVITTTRKQPILNQRR
ncbi:UDP-N-acetylmuramoyl-L-alanine--D-glutamate ligase [Erysipelothrix sp. HDW6A]|uniref:Mur ligase family protein n=1 Tax=Erysipelothrix sp. HDW6A TaxID=2714928 RepID=UPI001F100CA7|nr:Mur ligase family protein [Erysipelothrix sp. HDW6A]